VTCVCVGQAEEMALTGSRARTPEHYRSAVEGKTGALMGLACWLGAWAAGENEERAAAAGVAFGFAYQVADDLLDLCGPAAELGRPPGTDLALGVFTLPVILGLGADAGVLDDLPAPQEQ